tara:strand:+ start:116 stop:355 length:240 start_codon:yes stop_codon:yes gene_type:complete
MFYSEDTALWGFIAHIPLAIMFLAFLSRQVTLRDKGESLMGTIFDKGNKDVLNKAVIAGIFGMAVIGTLSPLSRLLLSS